MVNEFLLLLNLNTDFTLFICRAVDNTDLFLRIYDNAVTDMKAPVPGIRRLFYCLFFY